ncbi:hypothetical protein SLEP1_g34028 [Rubroshorea leprosula]|uniref:Uncharacterized protein n=1 Tax=Rubroshorea leprosula TaxID=152421 RepID=A0AAV5KII5_9ROSI|nr:hypothetical protein SLEP1_g34028 [Rubroshorea leprosula]
MRERTQLKKWKVGENLRTSSRTRFPHPSALSPRLTPCALRPEPRSPARPSPALHQIACTLLALLRPTAGNDAPAHRACTLPSARLILQSRPCCLHASHCCCTAPALLLATVHARRNLHHY